LADINTIVSKLTF